jgi:hypothetical protein
MHTQPGPHVSHPSMTQTPNEDCLESAGTGGDSSWQPNTSKHPSSKQLCPAPPTTVGPAPGCLSPWSHDFWPPAIGTIRDRC